MAVIVLFAWAYFISQDLPSLTEIENPKFRLATQLISADGFVLQNYYQRENRVNVQLHEISPFVIDGLIATEDLRFYQHSGIDPMTIPSIIMRYMRGTTSGGSTITMQLARNLFDAVGRRRNISRKIREIIVSAQLEQNFTKEEILTAYLNTVSIYGQTYGVEMASRQLFSKPSAELNLEEAAVIVAMLKGQGVFNPYLNPDTVVFRRNVVINKMYDQEMLDSTFSDLDSVKSLPLILADRNQTHIAGLAPYFREHVRKFMTQWAKERGYNLYADGLKIYTTLDSRLQKHAEEALKRHLKDKQTVFEEDLKENANLRDEKEILSTLMMQSYRYQAGKRAGLSEKEIKASFEEEREMKIFTWDGSVDTVMSPWDSLRHYSHFLEGGLISVEPGTGHIKAWVGGNDYAFFKYDHVAQGKRQVGSTFKPFVYAAALDNGRRPCDMVLNQPIFFENVNGEGEDWAPKNSNGRVGGLMTLRQGLATSTNLITASLMKDIGPGVVVEYAQAMGIKTPLEAVPALCLGTSDLNMMELTGAYTTFANQGLWIEPNFITRIEDKHGRVIHQFQPDTRQALSNFKAYEMLDLLKAVVDEPSGTASRLRYRYNFRNEIGGKTGTTQNHADGWFMGVVPQMVTGVWVGCSDRRMRFESQEHGQGASLALPIWAYYMESIYEDEVINFPQDNFAIPPGYIPPEDCFPDSAMYMRRDLQLQLRKPNNSDDFESFQ